jgi:hypothetical protein
VKNNYGDKVTDLAYGQWTKVTVSLATFFELTSDPFATNSYNVKMIARFSDTGCHDMTPNDGVDEELYKNFAGSLYMTGFEFIA